MNKENCLKAEECKYKNNKLHCAFCDDYFIPVGKFNFKIDVLQPNIIKLLTGNKK